MKEDNNIDVSILIPTFNRASFIKRAIDSSLFQTYPCEVIVCDHGSTDNTKSICESYGDKLRYIRRDKDYGIHFCELEALLAANGKYIHFCFDDDWMHYKFIEECIKLMKEDTGVVYSNNIVIDINSKDNIKDDWSYVNEIDSTRILSILKIPHVVKGLISPSAALIRKKFQQSLQIIVVEPSSANTLFESIKNKKPSKVFGADSVMGRLDCKEPSLSAFYSLSRTSNYFMHISDEYVQKKINFLNSLGIKTSASGGAGLAGLIYASNNKLFDIDRNSKALVFLTEGAI